MCVYALGAWIVSCVIKENVDTYKKCKYQTSYDVRYNNNHSTAVNIKAG